MTATTAGMNRRAFLQAALAASAGPFILPAKALGRDGAVPPSERLVLAAIGMGGRGTDDMQGFLGRKDIHIAGVCDVVEGNRLNAKRIVDGRYGNTDCVAVNDFRELTSRPDIDIVLIGTPDHWHAPIASEAMRQGKDVFSEKPETLAVAQGRKLVQLARSLGRVFSGGSQRVWEDYNLLHKAVRCGEFGRVKECYINVGGPSRECVLPAQPVPAGLDWDLWIGPAPMMDFNQARLNFRDWRDYSGGGLTDWGAHGFGGALFACGLQHTGPVKVTPPNGKDVPRLTYEFANGIKFYHGGGFGGVISMRLEGLELYDNGPNDPTKRPKVPDVPIPNYRGWGGLIGDFVDCVRTRELPFRDIEVAHRTVTVCHLGNLAYWLNRPLQWDPEKEEILDDPEANRWLDRPLRAPWTI